MITLGPAPKDAATGTTVTGSDTPTNGFDVDADVAALKAKPKQDYSAQWKQAEEPTNPTGDAKPTGEEAPPSGDAPPPPPPDPNSKAQASAREFIECYDMLQAQGFSMYSEKRISPEKFELEQYPKERAIHHLARGLELMGSPEVPWWIGLLIALAPSAFANFMAAKEARIQAEEKQAAAAKRNNARARNAQPLEPDSITDRNGNPVKPPPPPPPPAGDQPPPKQPVQPGTPRVYGACAECGNPLHKPRKKYCSQSCAGKATSRIMHQPKPAEA